MIEEVTQTIVGPSGQERTYTTSYTYDAAGRLKTRSMPYLDTQDEILEYRYAQDGRLKRVLSSVSLYVDAFEYDERGRPTAIVCGNGVTDGATFHPPNDSQGGRGNQLHRSGVAGR